MKMRIRSWKKGLCGMALSVGMLMAFPQSAEALMIVGGYPESDNTDVAGIWANGYIVSDYAEGWYYFDVELRDCLELPENLEDGVLEFHINPYDTEASVSEPVTEDGGHTWTFTVTARNGVTTEDYTIEADVRLADDVCGHNSYEWAYNETNHWKECTVCGSWLPYRFKEDSGNHDGNIEWVGEWIKPTYEADGQCRHGFCTVCGAELYEPDGRSIEELLEDEADLIIPKLERKGGGGSAASKQDDAEEEAAREQEDDTEDGLNESQADSQEAKETADPQTSGQNTMGLNGAWRQENGRWWFEKSDGGYPAGGWYECVGSSRTAWYYFDAQGYMVTGMISDGGFVYYLNDLDESRKGEMATGWQWINGSCYYFNTVPGYQGYPVGARLQNTQTPDGYTVDGNGFWTVDGIIQTK